MTNTSLDAEKIAEEAVAGFRGGGSVDPRSGAEFKVALVVSDDLKGRWTNRWASEFSHRFESQAFLKRGFITGLLWTSEPASATRVRDAILTSLHRVHYLQSVVGQFA